MRNRHKHNRKVNIEPDLMDVCVRMKVDDFYHELVIMERAIFTAALHIRIAIGK